ncbi:MAG: hypothetical protein JSU00_03325 [Acidobacteria bacterium]|nr:hypothetical protein [Acidobacteriota bacterium]
MSTKDHAKVGQFISGPMDPNQEPEVGRALPYVRHDVAFIPQVHINKCGDACASMLLQYRGRPIPAHIVNAINPRGVLSGLTTDDLKRTYPPAHRWLSLPKPEGGLWDNATLAYCLKTYGPIICNFPRHFVLLTGIHEDHLYIHDPWRGANLHLTTAEFNKKLKDADKDGMMVLNA